MKVPLLILMILISAFVLSAAVYNSLIFVAGGLILLTFVATIFARTESYKNYYKYDDPKLDALKQKIHAVIPEIDRINIYGSNQSFTIDKKDTYICSKDEKNFYYPDNMLVYVILHELAHALSPDIGHTKAWEEIFEQLLARAEEGGIYDSKIPVLTNYCGY